MGEHGEEDAGEEPGDDRLAQHRERARPAGGGMRRLGRAPAGAAGAEQEREQAAAMHRKAPTPTPCSTKPLDRDGADEADRAPDADPAVARDVEAAAAADVVRERRLADRNHAGGADVAGRR